MKSRRLSVTSRSCSRLFVATALVVLSPQALAFGPAAPPRVTPSPGVPAPLPPAPVPLPTAGPAAAPGNPMPPSSSPTSQPSPPPPPASRLSEARLHFQQGVALFQDQNYDAALAEFEGAYAISREPIVLYNIGLTHKALFRYRESIEALTRYIAEGEARPAGISRDKKSEVQKLIADMKSLLADVTLVLRPAAASVSVDGRPVVVPRDSVVPLAAGSHVIEASAPDFTSTRRGIVVVAGTPQTVSLVLNAIPRAGRVRVTAAQIGARVSIDGRDVGPSPVQLELLAGGHQLDVSAPGFASNRSELVVAAGQSRDVTISLQPPGGTDGAAFYHRWWFWAGVGVAAAATTAVIILAPRSTTQDPLVGTLGATSAN